MRRPTPVELLAAAASLFLIGSGLRSRSHPPIQPIDFSHRQHLRGPDQLDCALCHSQARRAAFADIAPVERCMGCHRFVRTSNPEVAKLRRAWESGKSIEWVKVYTLPRFVRFNHGAHARSGVTCDTCHGDVGSMARVARVTDLTMGWCIGCHRSRGASVDCLSCHY